MIELRDAVAADAEAVARIYVESWNDGFAGLLPARALTGREVERWVRDLVGPVRWRLAVAGGSVAGFAGTGPSRDPVALADESLGELDTIAVAPTSWRQGIGSLLMADAVAALRTSYDAAILWTLADYPPGDAFYRRHGWLPDGAVRDSGRQIAYRHTLADQ